MKYLPILIVCWYALALLFILFRFEWFIDNYDVLNFIESIACFIVLIHGLFKWNTYTPFIKSSCITIVVIALFQLLDDWLTMNNYNYYFFYTNILASNFIYGIIKSK